jgi:outer membrane protein TolC
VESLKKTLLVAAAGLLAAAHLQSARAEGPLTLRQCIDAAYGLSPALKAEQLDIDAAGEEIIKQRTALLPNVYATANIGVLDGYPISPFAIATGEDLEAGLVGTNNRQVSTNTTRTIVQANGKTHVSDRTTEKLVTAQTLPRQLFRANMVPLSTEKIEMDYPLFQNGSILGLNDAPAVANARAEKTQLQWTLQLGEEKVVSDLCNAFFVAQWYQQKLARDEARVHFSTQRLDIVKVEYDLKLMLAQDVELAKAELAADQQTLDSTKQSVRDSYAVLALLIGQPPGKVAKLEGKAPSFPELPPLDGLLERARTEHPAVGVQETVVEMARQQYRLDQAALLPSVIASTDYLMGQNLAHFSTASSGSPTQYDAGVTVNVPIFDWGSRLAQERESRTKVSAQQAAEDQVKMDVATSIAKLYDSVQDLERQFMTNVAAQVTASNAAALAREQRAQGALDQYTLVQDEEALLTAEDTTENTRLAALETYAQLEQAAGGAWKWEQ